MKNLSSDYIRGRGDVVEEFSKEFSFPGVPAASGDEPNYKACLLLAMQVASRGCTMHRLADALIYAASKYGIEMIVKNDPAKGGFK